MIVGGLYDDDDIRRNAGFQLFYMSINVGSVASPLVTGWLREHYGYHAGFFSAAVGMAIALVAFVYGRNKLSAFAFTIHAFWQKLFSAHGVQYAGQTGTHV